MNSQMQQTFNERFEEAVENARCKVKIEMVKYISKYMESDDLHNTLVNQTYTEQWSSDREWESSKQVKDIRM